MQIERLDDSCHSAVSNWSAGWDLAVTKPTNEIYVDGEERDAIVGLGFGVSECWSLLGLMIGGEPATFRE